MRCSQRTLGMRPRKDHRDVDLISDALPLVMRRSFVTSAEWTPSVSSGPELISDALLFCSA